ncbi:MAG: hypothetical protein ACYCV4_12260, partial [Dermatophilaceae bacterium]
MSAKVQRRQARVVKPKDGSSRPQILQPAEHLGRPYDVPAGRRERSTLWGPNGYCAGRSTARAEPGTRQRVATETATQACSPTFTGGRAVTAFGATAEGEVEADLAGLRRALAAGDPQIKGAQRTRLEAASAYLDVAPMVVQVALDAPIPDFDASL